MLGIGMKELVVILVMVLILFGAGRLPDIAKSMGKSVKEFKKSNRQLRSGRGRGKARADRRKNR